VQPHPLLPNPPPPLDPPKISTDFLLFLLFPDKSRIVPGYLVELRRDIPYGTINLQKFAHFYVLSAHYIALSRAIQWAEST
jgi:hypothetical protein